MAFTTITGASGAPTTYTGTDGVDLITLVNPGASDLRAEAGNDFIGLNLSTSATNQTLRGGQGNDTFQMTGASASLITSFIAGNLGDDQMFTTGVGVNATASTVQGGQGNDTISVSATNGGSIINGNLGNDTLNIAAAGGVISSASIFGGQGNDTINIGGANPIPTVTLAGVSIDGALGNDTIVIRSLGTTGGVQGSVNVTTISGGAGEDLIDATNAINFTGRLFLTGGADNDIILGSAVADNINGGDGQDFLQGNGGGDTISGGAGNDLFVLAAATDSLATSLVASTEAATITTGADIITSFTVGDVIRFNRGALTAAYTSIAAGGPTAGVLVSTNAVNFSVDNSAVIVRGVYNATTSTFTASGTGSDTWIGLDTNVATGTAATSALVVQGTVVNTIGLALDASNNVNITYLS